MSPRHRQIAALGAAAALALGGLSGCGRADRGDGQIGVRSPENGPARGAASAPAAADDFATLATKNTQRIPLASGPSLAVAVADAVFPGAGQRPPAVALADRDDWQAALAASVLMAPPLRAPLLLTDQGELPGDTAAALDRLRPTGAPAAAGAQAIRLGAAADPGGELKTASIPGADPYTLAAAVDEYRARVMRRYSRNVVVVPADDPAYAMPAAAWAAKAGDSILFTSRRTLPGPTRRALQQHQRPRIYLLGPRAAVSREVETELGKLGTVTRITGGSPQTSAIAFARFIDGEFGWGIVDPGHGLVLATPGRPLDAGSAAPLSASGSYGPLLLSADDGTIPASLRNFLRDIRPGYSSDPVRGVYNRAWIVGGTDAIPAEAQDELDGLLEITAVRRGTTP
jgi:hypothetical protein